MDKLINRLENFKFEDAHELARGMHLTHLQHETIRFLAKLYGNSGWIYGDVGQFLYFVMNLLCYSLKENK